MKSERIKEIAVVSLLVIVDQIIKLIIKFNFFDDHYNIIGDYVTFDPIINHKMSWLGNYIEFLTNPIVIILINIVAIYFIYSAYEYFKHKHGENKEKNSKIFRALFLIAIAGGICSLIDKIFWGGSLDYIGLKNLFIFDLKDVYISLFAVGLVFFTFKMDDEITLKEFFDYTFKRNNKKNKKIT